MVVGDGLTGIETATELAESRPGLSVALIARGELGADRTMRSVSHPNVYAAGDSAYAMGDNGRPLPMSCASAGYTGRQATAAIVGRLTGRKIANTRLDYVGNHISLGRRDGTLQMVDGEAQAKPKDLGGHQAARIEAGILKTSLWATSPPTFCLPQRKRRLAAAPHASGREGGRVGRLALIINGSRASTSPCELISNARSG